MTYANVTATLALFLALGGTTAFAASQLAKNSVGSKQIGNGQVKTQDLAKAAVKRPKIAAGAVDGSKLGAVDASKIAAGAVDGSKIVAGAVGPSALSDALRPASFDYAASTGSAVQQTILNDRGYVLAASCESSGGRPYLRAFLTFPETGHVDVLAINDSSEGPGTPVAGLLSVTGGVPLSDAVAIVPSGAGQSVANGGLITYTAPGRVAVITLHGQANDASDTCRLSGALIPAR